MSRRPSAGRDRSRERRRSPAQQLLRRPSVAALFAGIEEPLSEAVRRLGPKSSEVETAWRRLIRQLAPSRTEFDAVTLLKLKTHWRHLRGADYEAYVEALEREGQALAARGVPEEYAVVALALYLESCLTHLLPEPLEQKRGAIALVHLTAAIQRFVLAGYARTRTASWHRVEELERKKLSRDLHDEVGADLVVLKLYIEMIALELRKNAIDVARAKIEEALALVSHALESVRRITLDLGPAVLEQLGLVAAVRLYCRHFSARTGIEVRVHDGTMPASLPQGHETTLYRVLQGALSNIAKHAKARDVRIGLATLRNAVIVMVIEDDGVGFDPERLASDASYGLTAMRERIQALGGRLHVESRRGRSGGGKSGTRLEIDLPVGAEATA